MNILKNISLKKYNSFGIEAKAKYFVQITQPEQIIKLLETDEFQRNKRFVLGGGSNTLFRNDYDGLIISMDIRGLNLSEINPQFAIMKVGAGENWHEFVDTVTRNKYYGLENLALIPGMVGSAPVQNIGAYGVEQKDCFHKLEGINIDSGEKIEFYNNDCKFEYRNSIFKNELAEKIIITSVEYKLNRQWEANTSYKELKTELDKFSFIMQDSDYVLNTIIRIRRQKLPDPKIIGNAGSFFKNPVVDADCYGKIFVQFSDVPAYPQPNGQVKIPAAWLIEKCGWKGYRENDAGVFDKHALVLVNYGNASGEDIFRLSEKIIESVEEKFGVKLAREVIVL